MTDTSKDHAPFRVAFVPLSANGQSHCYVVLRQSADGALAALPVEGLQAIREYRPQGDGGWICAARAADGSWGYLDGDGTWCAAPAYQDARSHSDEGLARIRQNDLWGYADLTGALAIPARFVGARPFAHGFAAVSVGDNSWRVIDASGAFTSKETYFDLSSFAACGLAAARRQHLVTRKLHMGYVRPDGTWAIDPAFHHAGPFGADGVAAASLDGKLYGLIDTTGKWVMEPRYPRIRPFNDEGLAYFDEANPWYNGHGYLDATGAVVVKGERHLSETMVAGIVSNSYSGSSFLKRDGSALPTQFLSFATDFHEDGFAVARRPASKYGERGIWGLLQADGSFVDAPQGLLEPVTDGDGWVQPFPSHTPLVPFLTDDGGVAYVDRAGTVVWRIAYDGRQAELRDAGGAGLWRSPPCEACRPPALFFNAPAEDSLQRIASPDEIVPSLQQLADEVETRLHAFAAGDELSWWDDEDADEDEDDEDGGDSGKARGRRVAGYRRIMRTYVSELHNGPYEFMVGRNREIVEEMRAELLKRLTSAFGTPDPDPEHVTASPYRWHQDVHAWPVSLKTPIAGDPSLLPEARQLWISLHMNCGSDDGDAWSELWLLAAPSVDALDTALRARIALTGTTVQAEQRSEAAYLAALSSGELTLDRIPRDAMTEPLVAAALAADPGAIRHVPKRLMTPARYALAVEKQWRQFDDIPTDMLSEQACLDYVADGGWRLAEIPDRWRTIDVCAAAVRRNQDALKHVPATIRDEVEARTKSFAPLAVPDAASATDRAGTWLADRVTNSAGRSYENAAFNTALGTSVWRILLTQSIFAKTGTPPTLRGPLGWLEQRPVLTFLGYTLLGLTALVLHLIVTVAAFRSDGLWIGIATAILMGIAELYWAWRYLFNEPVSWGLGLSAVAVAVHALIISPLYRRIGRAYAKANPHLIS